MKRDPWIETLLELRRQHIDQIRSFHSDESNSLATVNRIYRLEVAELAYPLAYAQRVSEHIYEIKRLGLERVQRYQTLKRHQSEEIYNLMRDKPVTGQ